MRAARADAGTQTRQQPRFDDVGAAQVPEQVHGPPIERVGRGSRGHETETHERLCDGAADCNPHRLSGPARERAVNLVDESRGAYRVVVRGAVPASVHRRVHLHPRRVAVPVPQSAVRLGALFLHLQGVFPAHRQSASVESGQPVGDSVAEFVQRAPPPADLTDEAVREPRPVYHIVARLLAQDAAAHFRAE